MAEQDFFARVAQVSHPLGKEGLVAAEPLPFPPTHFQPSLQQAEPCSELPYEEDLRKFNSDLEELRLRYRPFLAELVPPREIGRPAFDLKEFDFRYTAQSDQDYADALAGKGEWQQVTVPDYRGPVGKWSAYYRRTFAFAAPRSPDQRVFLRFQGVDYIARVTLNNRFVGSHEGFFAPFEFDVTPYIRAETENVLLVEVQNDVPTIGAHDWGIAEDGDKLYAATGPGWDDPLTGWHHCPPGAGIYSSVFLEERAPVFVHSLFVRPNIDEGNIEARVVVHNSGNAARPFQLDLAIHPRNFEGSATTRIPCPVQPAGAGANYYRFVLPVPEFRLWSPEEPWLYVLRTTLTLDGQIRDESDVSFGMRKFHMDEEAEPRGSLFLNNRPILLRGANEMGHLQQCVMQGKFDQLVDDILIARLAHMNYYRITQRPVQEEIYDAFDRLGMLQQCDFPLFGYLRRNQFVEAVRQAGEMERLIRSHPSAIMVSLINEPFPIGKSEEAALYVTDADKGYRHLYREELEAFFIAARQAISIENPDRVVKNVEGDYDPPTLNGLSDFHCYTMWYTNHALPIGKLYKGFLPALKAGWKTGCGEYGTEGLDTYAVMRKRYPRDWLPEGGDQPWMPDRIVRSQTFSMHGDWFEEQNNLHDWIRESQRHQAFATRLLTDALRRRSDRIVSTAIHLLIDAWPAGWMKTLVGVDRVPKPAYFAFQRSLEPVRVNLRADRWKAYAGETLAVEAWVLNDAAHDLHGYKIVATLRKADQAIAAFELPVDAPPVLPTPAGIIPVVVPRAKDREPFFVDAVLLDDGGRPVNRERLELEAFERVAEGQPSATFEAGTGQAQRGFCALEDFAQNKPQLLEQVDAGARLWVQADQVKELEIDGARITVKAMNGLFFLARSREEASTRDFKPDDFAFWYSSQTGMIDFIATRYLECDRLTPLLFTYRKPGFSEFASGAKPRLPVVGKLKIGRGELILSALDISGRVGMNPVLDRFLKKLEETP
jgi:hypothetical protein